MSEFTGVGGCLSYTCGNLRWVKLQMREGHEIEIDGVFIALIILALSSVPGCQFETNGGAVRSKQEAVRAPLVSNAELCERVRDIKLLPHKDEPVADVAYNALQAERERVIPCLIRKITDETLMDDPRQAPKVGGVSVGDVAFFLVVDFGNADFVGLLPAEVKKAYEREGVYGYFRLIDENGNRKQLQEAAIAWYEKKYGRRLPHE